MTQRVAVIDYGMGNLHSVASAMEHVGAKEVIVGHDHDAIRAADRVIFPGVGAIRDCFLLQPGCVANPPAVGLFGGVKPRLPRWW